jgi:hypothetical protein
MPQLPTEADLQARHRSKRRWMVGIMLGVMLVLLVGGLLALSLVSSSMSISEAKRVVESVTTKVLVNGTGFWVHETRLSSAELDTLFGKYTTRSAITGPTRTLTGTGFTWHSVEFVNHSASSIKRLTVSWKSRNQHIDNETVFMVDDTLTGRDVLLYRWNLLKEKLGVK